MSVVAAAVIGSAAVGAYSSHRASKAQARAARQASDTQLQAQREANDIQLQMFEQSRKDMQPWRDAGVQALGQLTGGLQEGGDFNRRFTLADFQADPGYQFRLSEGMKGIENSAAARGSLLSGATLKALSRFNQDTASNEYQNAYNRWNNDMTNRYNRISSVAGVGQTATQQIGQFGHSTASNVAQGNMATANNVANNTMQAGNARASGYMGMANAVQGGIGNMLTLKAFGR